MMACRRWLALLACAASLEAAGQGLLFESAAEEWMSNEASEAAAAAAADELYQLREQPLNVNDTAALRHAQLLSPFQLRALCNYIILYGQLLTLDELHYVPGFDSNSVAALRPLLTARPLETTGAFRPWEGRHTLVAGLGGTLEQAAGYSNGHYEGDNLRSLLCYTYNYRDRLSIRLAADKAPGEAWGRDGYRSYHVMLSDMGRLQRLIVGHYNVQFGQGLTIWSGMAPFNIAGASPLRYGGGVRPAGAFYKDDYLDGAAATLSLGHGLSATAFGSRHDGETLGGAHLGYHGQRLLAGLTATYATLDESPSPRSYLYNAHAFRGQRLLNAGVDAVWELGRLTLYGEAAIAADSLGIAAAGGALLRVDSRNTIGISARHFDGHYHSLHAQPYGIGNGQGEQGVCLDLNTRLPLRIDATLSADLHRFATLRYGAYTPTQGQWVRARAERTFGRHWQATLRYAYRYKERNIPNIDSTLYLGEPTVRQQLQAEGRYTAGAWLLTLRGAACLFDAEQNGAQQGIAIGATARYTAGRLQATASATTHNVGGYYARIYMNESNLQYMWSMPALNGKGLRAYATLRYELNSHLTLAAKYALQWQFGAESIGSGDAQTQGPMRQTWCLQLRLKA